MQQQRQQRSSANDFIATATVPQTGDLKHRRYRNAVARATQVDMHPIRNRYLKETKFLSLAEGSGRLAMAAAARWAARQHLGAPRQLIILGLPKIGGPLGIGVI